MGYVEKLPNGRWKGTYRILQGSERSKTFDRKIDAQHWLDARLREVRVARDGALHRALEMERIEGREAEQAELAEAIALRPSPIESGTVDLRDELRGETAWTYRAIDFAGEVLYVGLTSNLRRRLAAHRETSGWWTLATTIEWDEWPSREVAEREELRLIRSLCPRFNVVGRSPWATRTPGAAAASPRPEEGA